MNENRQLPKIKLKLPAGNQIEDVFDMEQARDLLNFGDGVITVEGKTVHSYEELLVIANENKHKEFIEVALLQVIEGG